LKMDLEDARTRLEQVRKAVLAKDEAERQVAALKTQLAQANRRLKEATWNMSLLLNRARTEG
jgi:predicted  nucleic acid-binding Zn-ribbon protein